MGTNSILKFIEDPKCEFVRFYTGYEDGVIKPTFVPFDDQGDLFLPVFFDTSRPCPPFCPEPGAEPCIAS